MSDRFDKWFDWLMIWEGESYENDPDDPGGETKYGIDKRSHPNLIVRELTRDRAKAIYYTDYWLAVCADDLPFGVGEVVADIAVNNGKSRAIRKLQYFAGADVDGEIGPKTLAKAQAMNRSMLVADLLDWRDDFYRSIAKGRQAKFLRGWLNRNNDLRRFIQAG